MHLERVSFGVWLIDRQILSEAHFMRFTAYRTSNITNEARSCSLWFIDQGIFKSASCGLRRTEREMLHLKRASCCGTRNITLEARFFLLVLKERGKLHLAAFKVGLFCIWLIQRGILHLKRACFGL